MLRTVKLHHVTSHAADDILWHGREQHYSAQVVIAQCLGALHDWALHDVLGIRSQITL